MSSDFVKNTKTGQVLRYNKSMGGKKHLRPCPPPWEDQGSMDVETVSLQVDGQTKGTTDIEATENIMFSNDKIDINVGSDLLDKKEADIAIRDLFDRDVTKVTVSELTEYADEHGVEVPYEKPTKLQLISSIVAAKDFDDDSENNRE